jgi:hypothetical protein
MNFISEAVHIANEIKTFADTFGLSMHHELTEIIDLIDTKDLEGWRQKEAERIAAADAKQQAYRAEQHVKQLADFRSGLRNDIYHRGEYDYLRVIPGNQFDEGKTVLTSQGVTIPGNEAKRFYSWLIAIAENGGCEGNCNEMVSHTYQVQMVTPEYVVIGCHKITIDECKNAYNQL